MLLYKRELEAIVSEIKNHFPILLVTGPRQVGKTTLLKHLEKDKRTYVTLDDPMIRKIAVTTPELFLQRYKPPIFIDEVQYAPELFNYIKIYVDEHRNNGDIWLTGSQMFHLMQNVSESLAGRVGIVNMLGLSTGELQRLDIKENYSTNPDILLERLQKYKKKDLMDIYSRIHRGSMPALYAQNQPNNTEMFFASYVDTYLQRDVRELTKVGDEISFLKFLSCAAARTGQVLNYADIAKDAGISAPTAKNWISILVTSGIAILIEPYFNNVLKRSIKSPKFYFLDTGLCAYLTRWTSPEILESGAMSGAIFETYIISEIIKSFYNQGKRPPIYYYRDKDGVEIDLLIEQNGTFYPIEIKKNGNPGKDSIKHFKVLDKIGLKHGTGNVICMCSDLLPIDENNWYVPAWLI